MPKITATHYIHDLKVEIIDINATDAPYRVTNLVTGDSWECLVESIAWHNCATLLRGTKSNQDYLLYSLNHPDHEAVKLTRLKVQIRNLDGWADFKMRREYETAFYATEADALADYRDAYSPAEFRVVDGGTPVDGDIYGAPLIVKLTKFKVQIPSTNGWADLKASVYGAPYEVELYDSEEAALDDVSDELHADGFRIVFANTPADDDLYQ